MRAAARAAAAAAAQHHHHHHQPLLLASADAAPRRPFAAAAAPLAAPNPTANPEPRPYAGDPPELSSARRASLLGGGPARIAAQHSRHKLTARERLTALLDANSFVEAGALAEHRCRDFGMGSAPPIPGDGVVTGSGSIHGRPVYVFAQDFTVLGGSLSEAHAAKIARLQDRALKSGVPLVALCDSGGARIQEGVLSLAGYAEVFQRNVDASGCIPQISAVMGPCAGGAVYSPALTDFVLMVRGEGRMFLTGPDVVRAVTREEVTQEELGGASVHATRSGVAAAAFDDDLELLAALRELYSYLPLSCAEEAPVVATRDPPGRLCPALERGAGAPVVVANGDATAAKNNNTNASPYKSVMHPGGEEEQKAASEPAGGLFPSSGSGAYDARSVISEIVDDRRFFEISKEHAPNVTVALARMGGGTVGVVANNPAFLAGVLDIDGERRFFFFWRRAAVFFGALSRSKQQPRHPPNKTHPNQQQQHQQPPSKPPASCASATPSTSP
jgi:propionyl-CoA carboxylase beta chain